MKFKLSKENSELAPSLQKALLPRKEFVQEGKQKFLAAFDISGLARPQHAVSKVTLFFKFGIGALAAVAIVAGATVYADTANVSASSAFYPLKRLGENVQYTLTPTQDKAQLQATFATRRVQEIKDLQANNASSTLIPALTDDIDEDVSSSLSLANKTDLSDGSLNTYCTTILNGRFGNALLHFGLSNRFRVTCAEDVGTSTAPIAGPLAPITNSAHVIIKTGPGGYHHRYNSSATSTTGTGIMSSSSSMASGTPAALSIPSATAVASATIVNAPGPATSSLDLNIGATTTL
jgi:hypothetical protein